jgi:hypothetical protein
MSHPEGMTEAGLLDKCKGRLVARDDAGFKQL